MTYVSGSNGVKSHISFISIWVKSHISFSFTRFCYYRKHPNNDNKFCSLLCSTCFKQHFHDCFQIDPNCSPFQSLNILSFHIRHERLKVIRNGLISHFLKYYFKTGTFPSFSYLHIYLLLWNLIAMILVPYV